MMRRFGAGLAVLALLQGFAAAPYTHGHSGIDAVSDEHHPHGHSLVHTHAFPHAHHDDDDAEPQAAGGTGHSEEQIWSVDSFVFAHPVISHPPAPVVPVFEAPPPELTSVWLGAYRPQPKAHGPPLASCSLLRAPPAFPPSFA
jgi:hypothetical protein